MHNSLPQSFSLETRRQINILN